MNLKFDSLMDIDTLAHSLWMCSRWILFWSCWSLSSSTLNICLTSSSEQLLTVLSSPGSFFSQLQKFLVGCRILQLYCVRNTQYSEMLLLSHDKFCDAWPHELHRQVCGQVPEGKAGEGTPKSNQWWVCTCSECCVSIHHCIKLIKITITKLKNPSS